MSSLLDDLNDLGPDEDEDDGGDAGVAAAAAGDSDADDSDEGGGAAVAAAGAPGDAALTDETAMPRDAELDAQAAALGARAGFRSVARLRETRRFTEHMARVGAALAAASVPPVVGALEEWPEYRLILASNALVAALDDELAALHAYVVAAYAPKFPELANIVPAPSEYVRAVQRIGNETDLTLVDLGDVLPSAQVMVVTVTGSTTAGRPLPPAALDDVVGACAEFGAVEAAKARVLAFVESRMAALAPNTSALLGTRVAAVLVGIAGGLAALSRIPACNVEVLGHRKRGPTGLSRGASATPHAGALAEVDIVRGAPPPLRRKAVKVLAAKVVLTARVDCFHERADGGMGAELRAAVAAKVRKWQEPPPGKSKKPLPAPDDKPTKRRGGRRHRAMKAKMGMTDVRREANRTAFAAAGGGPGGEYSSDAMGTDLGMLGAAGSGRLKLERRDQKIVKKRRLYEGGGGPGGSSGATGGAASSLVFTPSQGIALANPAAAAERAAAGAAGTGYFAASGSFSQVRPGT